MKNFKLIAIRPSKGCNKKISKILSEEVTYVFYNNYDFSLYTENNKIIQKSSKSIPDLYSITNNFNQKIKINISAIAGENGSGKSSLVELLYASCYNISAIRGILYEEEEGRHLNQNDIVPDINVEIYYEINEVLYQLKLEGPNIYILKWESNNFKNDSELENNLEDFFYTIAINYSLHSLNSTILGDWLKKIFHKNDGYQTPIVLNPYRDKGNIEINNEEYLVKSRLISNILGKTSSSLKNEDSLKNVIDNKVAYRLKVELNREKFKYGYDYNKTGKPLFELTKKYGNVILPKIYKYFLNDENFAPKNTLLNRYAKEYILYKLKSISTKYSPYKYKNKDFLERPIIADEFLSRLSKDKSHITFKLVQAINFLSNELYYKRKESFDLTISYLSNELDKQSKLKGIELINILPPAFFKIDIEFKDADMFSLLSSGEKQRIYSIATLIYHLNNLSSIESDTNVNRLSYKRVNIIFDELELYFHPELQRSLINDIIENVKRVNLKEIYAINILLITHSPFILSDIPESNILFMTNKGLPEINRQNIRTFGGNIHELLANSFFLNNGLIGEFARNRIQSIISSLDVEDKKGSRNINPETLLEEIQIIGEPFLKEKLLEMYYSKFNKQKRIEELRQELKRLENND